ncbi:MAG: hypothetical protein MI684_04805 [Chlorobiales bacterium]|nr:hypothetical protein [Chlorobiales bacterium]
MKRNSIFAQRFIIIIVKIAIAYRSTVFECLDVTNIVAAAHEACRALPLDSMPEKTYSANQPTSSFAGSEQLYL